MLPVNFKKLPAWRRDLCGKEGLEMESHLGLLLIVRGLPGCGKSTLVRNILASPFGQRFISLDPDAVNVAELDASPLLNFEGESVPKATLVYRFLLQEARDALSRGVGVLWDQPHGEVCGGYGLPEVSWRYP